jgi:hypothetical protein
MADPTVSSVDRMMYGEGRPLSLPKGPVSTVEIDKQEAQYLKQEAQYIIMSQFVISIMLHI